MAILDDSSLKIDPYYKTTNGYTHMYLASDDVLMKDDATTLQTKIDRIDAELTDTIVLQTVSVPIACAAGKTYKTTTNITTKSGYMPLIALVRGTGSNNIYNYYIEVRQHMNGIVPQYSVYSEWKNPSTTSVSNATAAVVVIWGKSVDVGGYTQN